MGEIYSKIEIQSGCILRVFSMKETWKIEKKWMDTFCRNKQGANTTAYKWHIFSFKKYPSISGIKAEEKYLQQKTHKYIILSNGNELAVETDILPQECNLSDYYVFPKNLAWTMAFTHEDGWFGPYFATHLEYDRLNAENMEQLKNIKKKQKEITIAKKKGWM